MGLEMTAATHGVRTDTTDEAGPVFQAKCGCCAPTGWGEPWELGSAAFWIQQAVEYRSGRGRHSLGRSLREEVAACMLGGYGVPGAVGNAAFHALRDAGLLDHPIEESVAAESFGDVLSKPLRLATGRTVHYRFHRQRPRRLAAALSRLTVWEDDVDDLSDVALRDRLMTLPGIGPKTASWVVRNYRDSDSVAIIDIHIYRAGLAAGVFCADWNVARDYGILEEAFLRWADTGTVSAANLDAAIWQLLSSLGQAGQLLTHRSAWPTAADGYVQQPLPAGRR